MIYLKTIDAISIIHPFIAKILLTEIPRNTKKNTHM